MSKYVDYIKKQKEVLDQLDASKKGEDYLVYTNLIDLDREYLASMNYSQSEEVYVEEEQKYNLYSEHGLMYKVVMVQLYNLFSKNGFQLPDAITQKCNLVSTELNQYQSQIGNFSISTLKYVLATDLGLRAQMQQFFGEEIINEEFFPKLANVKQSIKTIKTVMEVTLRKKKIASLSTDKVKQFCIDLWNSEIVDLENKIQQLSDGIVREGVFNVESHPEYIRLQTKLESLKQKVTNITAMSDPSDIERVRTQLLADMDYESKYEELKKGKTLKGDKSKEALEKEKKSIEEVITSYSAGGATFTSVEKLMQEIKADKEEIVDIEKELSELKALIDKYDKQDNVVIATRTREEQRRSDLSNLEQEYDRELDEWDKMLFIQKHTKKGKEKEKTRIEIRRKVLASKKEIESHQHDVSNEEYVLREIEKEILKKIELLQKNGVYRQFFVQNMPANQVSFEQRYRELKKFTEELEKKLEATKESIKEHENAIATKLNRPAGTVSAPEFVYRNMAQVVSEQQEKSLELDKALEYATLEQQQPSYFSDLEAGLAVVEEYSSRKK